jgi:hypothetical protein
LATTGILNQSSQEHSYVRNVAISNVLGAGLVVNTARSQNAGPYENLYIAAGANNTSTKNECVVLGGTGSNVGPGDSRGIHGMNCIGNGVGTTGIDLSVSNATLEDVTVSGYANGIVVGDLATVGEPVQSDVLMNIKAAPGAGTMTNLILLSNASAANTSDIDLLAISNTVATNTINDQLSNTTVTGSQASFVAMYALGQPMNVNNSLTQYSRFTTVPSLPSWAAGTVPIAPGSSCSSLGSLYSNTMGTSSANNNLYACVPVSASGAQWKAIK